MKRLSRTRWARATASALVAVVLWTISPMPAIAATRRPAGMTPPRPQRRTPLRVLGDEEMTRLRGAGYRMEVFAGRHPWWEFEKGVNVTGAGNLVKSYTDLSLPGCGLNLDFVRSYNSLDSRVGPFGIGWTHSYDIFLVDDDDDPTTVSRTTRSGTRFFYQRNADGLYTPPAHTHDQFTSTYQTVEDTDGSLISVPVEDKIITRDGTVYVFQSLASQPDGSPSPVRQIVRINDRHVGELNPLGNHIGFTYGESYLDADGHARRELDTITDTVGRVISLTHTPEHRLASLNWTCDGQPRAVTYQYNADHNLAAATDPCNRATSFGYHDPGDVYNESGVLERITDPAGHETVYTYTVPHVMYWLAVETVTEPTGLRTWFYYSSPAGWEGMVTWSWEDVNTGEWVGYTGEGIGRFGAECHNDASYRFGGILTTAPCRQYYWDCANNLVKVEELLGFDHLVTTVMTYDAVCDGDTLIDPGMGRLLSSSSTPDGVEWYTTSYEYETIFNDPTRSTDPNGHVTRCEYDPDTGDPRFQYDANYPQTGARTEIRYNEFGQRIELIDPNEHSTHYEYGDAYGNLTAVVDALGRRTEFSYDSVGNLRFKTDAKGQTTEYRYYPDNQVSDIIFDGGATIHYTYDAAGRPATVTDDRGTMTFQYDPVGHLTAVTDPVLGAVSYQYYVTGNRETITHDGQTTTYYYSTDNANRVTAIVDHAGRVTNYLYDVHGNRQAVIYPNRAQINSQVHYVAAVATYDRLHRLLTIEGLRAQGSDPTGGELYYGAGDHPVPGGDPLTSRAYTYDPAGNRLTCAMSDIQGDATVQYTYDPVNALTDVDYGGGSTAHYVYDPAGNRVQATEDGQVTTYTYDAANQLTAAGSVTFQHDANGNCTARIEGTEVTGYQWDARDVLSQVDLPDGTHTDYAYDALGRMVETVSPAGEVTRILRDQELPLAERDELGQLLASYVAGDGLLVGREADGQMWCYLHDVQGSVIAFTDNDRNVAASYRYGAFGDLRSETGGVSNRFRYTGAHGLPTDATALVHMGMRSYLPTTGRFLSLDPQRQGVNWYRYGENNPVNYIDPSGEWSEESVNPWLRIAAGISFIAFGIKCLFWGVAALQTFVGFLAVGLPDSMMSLLMFGGALIAGLAGIALGIELIAYGRNLIHGALIEIIDEW